MKKIYLKTMALALGILGWSGTTNAQYCTYTGTGSSYYINNFSTTGGVTNITNNSSGFSAGGYNNATAMIVSQYATASVNFSAAVSGGSAGFNIWVDWNNNQIFDVAEQMYASGSYIVTTTGTITVPSGTAVGSYRMRMTSDYLNTNPPACGSTTYGEAEDYTFTVTATPTCLPVSALTSTGVTTTTADISWALGGSESSWNVEWGAPGYTPGIGNEIGAASNPSTAYTITGLTAGTSYDVYVQANCGGGDLATWYGPLAVYTGYCLYSGGNASYFINNFSTTGGATNNISNLNSGFATNGYQDATSMKVNSYEGADVNFTVAFGSQTYYSFGFNIWVDWNDNLIFDASEEVYSGGYLSSPSTGTISIPAGTTLGDHRMRIAADYNNGDPDPCTTSGYKEVEDYTFTVTAIPSCLPITALTTTGNSLNTVDISWTAGALETSWNIEWGVPGFAPGTGAEIGAATNPSTAYTITGLTANTHYDVYVQADCSGGDLATWVELQVFTGYCVYTGGNSSYYINNFSTTGGLPTNISNLNSGFAPNGYQDASAMKVSSYEGADINFNMTFGLQTYYSFGVNIWVDWNNNLIFDATEQVYSSGSYVTSATGTISIPTGTPLGDYRIRVAADETNTNPDACSTTSDKEVEDYTFTVVAIPSCLPISGLTVDNFGLDSIQVSWTAGGIETSWNVEWGMPGFTPGNGTGIGAASTPTTTYTVTGLNPSSNYDIYVQANCGSDSSYWHLVQGSTLCGAASIPWTENFDQLTTVGPNIFPLCWNNESGNWATTSGSTNFLTDGQYPYNDFIWTPEFALTVGVTYEFSFSYNGNGHTNWDAATYVSPSQSSIDAVVLDTIVNSTQTSSSNYVKAKFCFTPDSTHNYSFGIKLTNNSSGGYFDFDDFSLRIPPSVAGTDGATTVCQTGGLVDLNSIITINDTTGMWMFGPNPSAIQHDTLFNPAYIPSGTTNVYYVINGCYQDSAKATINIYPKSNAGTDGTVSTCNYGPFNLFDGLTGSVDLGGQWYNPASQPIPGSIVNFNGQIAANYNYIYVVNNGVCPNDTSVIEIQLQDCAGVDEYELKGFVLYPNPSNGVINIQYSGKGEDVKLDVVDAKGAIVWSKQILFNDGTTQSIDISTVENGVYYINMTSKNGGSVMKVIKN